MKPKIFIHHEGALGDVILSLPALRVIRSDSIYIHLAARADIGNLLKQGGIVEEISRSDSSLYLSLYTGHHDTRLRRFLCRFNRAFIFTSHENSIITNSIRTILPDTEVIKTVPPENVNIHVSEFRIKQLTGKTEIFFNIRDKKYFNIPAIALYEAHKMLIKAGYSGKNLLISIHPGSGGAGKCWKLEYYLELAENLMRDYKAFVIIFTGHAESEEIKTEINNFIIGKKNVIHISNTELITVSALLSISDIYIGNDSGISHLASLFCKKAIVIFGPTNHMLWRPAGDNVTVVTSEQKCAPCNDKTAAACTDRKCLLEIPVSRIVEKINSRLRFLGAREGS